MPEGFSVWYIYPLAQLQLLLPTFLLCPLVHKPPDPTRESYVT